MISHSACEDNCSFRYANHPIRSFWEANFTGTFFSRQKEGEALIAQADGHKQPVQLIA